MELPAQAVKGELFGIFPPFQPADGKDKDQPKEIYQNMLKNLDEKEAVAVFTNKRRDGTVGQIAYYGPPEMICSVIL